jgi:N4-gp56 family major capsid protein
MATTDFGVNSPLAVKLWSERLFREALKQTQLYQFIGEGPDSMIQKLVEPSKGAGDKVTVGLRMQLSGDGVSGDGTLEGQEEAMTFYSDALLLDQLRNAVRSAGKMSEQRVPYSIRNEAFMGLQDWWAARFDTGGFNQLCGNTGQTDTKYTGNNAAIAPSANNIYYANGHASEASVLSASASNAMNLKFIDYALETAKTNSPAIRPFKYMGQDYYVAFLHPYQVTALRNNSSAGQWLDIQQAAFGGYAGKSEVETNPIFTGALGVYNNVVLHESTYIPFTAGTATAGVRRGVLCGAQALLCGFGQENSDNKASWVEELFDYGNQLGVSAGFIYGQKKAAFNSQDFGTVVISTYAGAQGA